MTIKNTIKNIAKIGALAYLCNFGYQSGKEIYNSSKLSSYPEYREILKDASGLIRKKEAILKLKESLDDVVESNKFVSEVKSKLIIDLDSMLKRNTEEIQNSTPLIRKRREKFLLDHPEAKNYEYNNGVAKAIFPIFYFMDMDGTK